MVGDTWEPETGEKGLRGLVRLTELRGLAGLFVLNEPDAPLATVEVPKDKRPQLNQERWVTVTLKKKR